MRRRTFIKAAQVSGASSLAIGLAGCTGSQDGDSEGDSDGGSTPAPTPASTPESTPPESMQEMHSTQLAASHYPLVPHFLPILVGLEKGTFEAHNVNVEDVVSFAGGGNTVRGIVTGGIGAGAGALPALLKAYFAGAPIHLVGLLNAHQGISYWTLPDSSIESIMDLKGGAIGVSSPGSSTEAGVIRAIQNTEGLALSDVEIKYVGGPGEAITTLNEGLVDAVYSTPPLSTKLEIQGKIRRVWRGRDLAPNVTQGVTMMGNRIIQEEPELGKGILAGIIDGIEYIVANVEESGRIWSQAVDIPEEVGIKALKDEEPEEFYQIELDEDIVKTTASTLIAQGIIDDQPPWEKVINQSLLPEDRRVDWV